MGPASPKSSEESEAHKTSKAADIGIGVGGTMSACSLLITVISIANYLKKKAVASGAQPRTPPGWATKGFEGLAILGKGGLILALIALATINGNVSYVSENPKKFMKDALATGGFGALAAVFLTLTRGRRDLFFNHLIFAFMLFFLYHVCRELAGYFTIFGTEKKTENIKKEEAKFTKPILIGGGALAFAAIGLALIARAPPDYTAGILKSAGPSTALFIETVIFVIIVTFGEIIVAKNHGDPIGPAIGTSAVIFTLAHLVLQSGGFYNHLYTMAHVAEPSVTEAVKVSTNVVQNPYLRGIVPKS
jgi:hypothetical protein